MSPRGSVISAVACAIALLGCGRSERLEPCNVSKEQCQIDVYYAVMRVRGDGWDPFDGLPPIRTITLEQYAKELKKRAEAQAEAEAMNPNAGPVFMPWTVALQLLGFVTPTMTSGEAATQSRIDNVAAFYSSSTGNVTVIDRGGKHDDYWDTRLLAHELVHAFQDNELSGTIGGDTIDGSFTGRAQVEGEAELYENLIGAELGGYEPQQQDWAGLFRDERDWLRAGMAMQAAPFYAADWFVYSLGTNVMMRTWLEGGNVAVRELGSKFPRHSVMLMAASDGESVDVDTTLSCEIQAPDEAFYLSAFNRLGGMELYAFMAGGGATPDDEAWKRAKRWQDDTLWIFGDEPSGRVAVTWRIRMADAKSADVVVAAAAQREGLRAERIGSDVLIVGSNDEDIRDDWAGARDCAR